MWLAVVSHSQDGQKLVPALGVLGHVVTQLCSNRTIVPFDLTVGLWVVRGGAHRLDSEYLHHGDEKV